jgi:chondroitin AC lyase
MKSILFVCAIIALFAGMVSAAPSPDIATAIRQYRELLSYDVDTPADPTDELREARALTDQGSWPDLDYKSKARSEWPPTTHAYRILALTEMAEAPGIKPGDKKELLAAVHRSFAFWIKNDLKCTNWWPNQIGIPKTLGNAAIILGDDLRRDEFQYMTGTLLPRSKIGMTGQNRVWLSGNTLVLGLLTDDRAIVDQASGVIWEEIRVSKGEGIQADYSFQQHGPQQQFGNYGGAFAGEVCRWGQILRGTPWAIPPAKLAIYRDYLLNGQNWVTYRGSMDISSCGRQLFPGTPRSKAQGIIETMRAVATFDPPHSTEYLAFVHRNTTDGKNDLIGDRCFWRSDYVVHRAADFFATVRMHSARTIGIESLNGENLSGYYLSDGATYFYHQGDEYKEIFPVWDWRKIPGVTCPQSDTKISPPSEENLKTDRTFVGGVTDGQIGCDAMDYDRDGVTAKKAWFFDGDVAVCLGAGIRSTGDKPIATTINQCLHRGTVAASAAGKKSVWPDGDQTVTAADWIEQDGLRYSFPAPVDVQASIGPRTGNWHHVYNNPGTPKADVKKDLFTLVFDHRVKPDGATYAYAVGPAGQMLLAKVLANTESAQAVSPDDHHTAIVFWKPGQLEIGNGLTIEVDQPCTLIVDAVTRHITISDPTHLLKSMTLTIGGTKKPVSFPIAGEAGRSIEIE